MKFSVRKTVEYVTGAVALLIVAAAVVLALIYAIKHGVATLDELAAGTLQGVGCAIGGLIGGALVLRFQTARDFLHNLIKEVVK